MPQDRVHSGGQKKGSDRRYKCDQRVLRVKTVQPKIPPGDTFLHFMLHTLKFDVSILEMLSIQAIKC